MVKAWLLHLGQSTKHDRVDLGHFAGKWLVICLKRGHYVGAAAKIEREEGSAAQRLSSPFKHIFVS